MGSDGSINQADRSVVHRDTYTTSYVVCGVLHSERQPNASSSGA